MIEITNNGKTVSVTDNNNVNNEEYLSIRPNKKLTLKPREKFCINTGLTIECTSEADECWIYSDPIFDPDEQEIEFSDNIGILTHRITKEDGKYQLQFIGGYMGDVEVTIPKGTEIARIYKSIKNPDQKNGEELSYNIMYETENLIIRTSPEYLGRYEIITEPSGYTYIKINL